MDLKRLASHFSYKIEQKPEGGFIARATDPSVPAIEAPTRQEVIDKVRQNIMSTLSTEFPALKDAAAGKKIDLSFHVERTPAGGFEIHSADQNAPVTTASSQQDLQSQLVEKFLNFAGQHVVPEFSKALAAQAAKSGSSSVEVVIKGTTFGKANSTGITFGSPAPSFGTVTKASELNAVGAIGGAPITPESNSNWKWFGLMLLLIGGAVMYFFFHLR
jgi:hypothetical protein